MPYTNVDEKVASPKGKVTKKGGIMASTTFAVATMKVAQIPKPGADFEIAEREIPQPTRGQVRIKVQACGICHSDVLTKDGGMPGIQYPRIPGHEIAGVVDELGDGRSDSASASAGTAVMTARVSPAAAEIFAIAGTCRFRVSVTTAATSNSWWPRLML